MLTDLTTDELRQKIIDKENELMKIFNDLAKQDSMYIMLMTRVGVWCSEFNEMIGIKKNG